MLKMENYQGTTNYNLVEDKDIVDNLTTSATNKALSANQGKLIFDNIDNNNKMVQLWSGSTMEWTNTVTLSDNFRNYSDLFFITSEYKYVCHIKIPKNIGDITPCVLTALSWDHASKPVITYFSYETQSSSVNTLTFVSQAFNWSTSDSSRQTVVAIYGIKRMFNE